MTVVADNEGIQTPGYAFVNHSQKQGPWQGQWIWLPAEAGAVPPRASARRSH